MAITRSDCKFEVGSVNYFVVGHQNVALDMFVESILRRVQCAVGRIGPKLFTVHTLKMT
jgi:hypothetical protein